MIGESVLLSWRIPHSCEDFGFVSPDQTAAKFKRPGDQPFDFAQARRRPYMIDAGPDLVSGPIAYQGSTPDGGAHSRAISVNSLASVNSMTGLTLAAASPR
jgi:hypothetical protein